MHIFELVVNHDDYNDTDTRKIVTTINYNIYNNN